MSQTIFRTQQLTGFTTLPNELLRDSKLSFKARGVLAMVLSQREDWIVYKGWLEKQGTEGREAIQGAIEELTAAGYVRTYTEQPREGGKFSNKVWHFYDVPVTDDGKPLTVNRERETVDGFPAAKKEQEKEEPSKKADVPSAVSVALTSFLAKFIEMDTLDFAEAWDDWLTYRKKRKLKPYADGGLATLEMLSKLGPDRAIAAIHHSRSQNYQGIYEPREKRTGRDSNRNAGTYNEGRSKSWKGFERTS